MEKKMKKEDANSREQERRRLRMRWTAMVRGILFQGE
jgi:hypothetical protein